MNFAEYQRAAMQTATYPSKYATIYPALGIAGEAGELANKVKKSIRDGSLPRDAILAEVGDVLWYCAALASDLGAQLDDVAEANLEKLRDRKARGVLGGSGDSR